MGFQTSPFPLIPTNLSKKKNRTLSVSLVSSPDVHFFFVLLTLSLFSLFLPLLSLSLSLSLVNDRLVSETRGRHSFMCCWFILVPATERHMCHELSLAAATLPHLLPPRLPPWVLTEMQWKVEILTKAGWGGWPQALSDFPLMTYNEGRWMATLIVHTLIWSEFQPRLGG